MLIGGLDFWQFDPQRPPKVIQEPRLRDALAERLRGKGRELSLEYAFREPPSGDDASASPTCGVKVLEFPQWFVCQGERCRSLVRSDGLEKKGGRYRHVCSGRDAHADCVPVRFVHACRRGHVDEFPWIIFAHKAGICAAPQLSLREGATGDFSEVEVRCVCGQSERLSSALASRDGRVSGREFPCTGARPWLGPEGREKCEEKGRLLVRTATHSYFAQIQSALSIPERARELEDAVRREWAILQAATPQNLTAFRAIPAVGAALRDFPDADVLAAIDAIRAGKSAPREPIRSAEYRQLTSAAPEQPGSLPPADALFHVRRVVDRGAIPPQISHLVLAHKLREVRVQVGFTRLESVTPDLQGDYDVGVQVAALGLATDWLPACEARGEGVFLAFDEEALKAWEARPAVQRRDAQLRAGHAAWATTTPGAPPYPGVRFYLLHSLAHLLITAISLECGYAASSIRERIYCTSADDPVLPMAGILLSTGAPGAEGTLGGLVDQGRRILGHLRRAWDTGRLCSNDPVCSAHDPVADRTERPLEGAACYGCLFVAECSCERFNRFLDRALVLPAIGHDPELAFFGARPGAGPVATAPKARPSTTASREETPALLATDAERSLWRAIRARGWPTPDIGSVFATDDEEADPLLFAWPGKKLGLTIADRATSPRKGWTVVTVTAARALAEPDACLSELANAF